MLDIFPETAKLFVRFGNELPPMTTFTLMVSDFLVANPIPIAVVIFLPPVLLFQFSRTKKGKYLVDQYMLKIPIMGPLIHKTLIEVFCRVFYTLYHGSAESIEPVRIAAEATGNTYFEDRIKSVAIPLMLKKGVGVTDAFAATGVFTETAISRNGKKIAVSGRKELEGSYVVYCEGGSRNRERTGDLLQNVYPRVTDIRKLGSAGLETAWVASGRSEAYFTTAIGPWDVAAGALLVSEARGRVTDFNGNPWKPERGDFLFSNGHVHARLLELLL